MVRKTIVSKSLRPKSREEAFKQKQERYLNEESARLASEDFGDTEFRAELEDQLSWNPIARLGYDPKSGKTDKLNNSKGGYAAYVPESNTQDSLDNLLKSDKAFSNFVGKVSPGDVFLTTNLAETPIWSHEYTHKGVDKLDQYYKKDPKGFKEKYGIDAANLLEDMAKGSVEEEEFTELFDDLSAELHGIRKNMAGYADHEFSPSAERGRERLQEALKNSRASDLSGFGVYNLESGLGVRLKGSVGLALAAEDLLKEQGEPPRSEQAEPSLFDKLKSKIGFAEGGEVKTMEEQMRLFEEGGIADDGMSVDPVSGNEIPPGSLAKEVRDDIPAQLSEGEYVVPADVLRYYGVRFFEDLRSEAKQGLAQMESNGRIGGEPVPAGGPQMGEGDLTPEEMAVLQEMGMNVGGYVPQQQPPEAVGNTTMQMGMSTGYDKGGLEDGVDRASITTPGFTEESLRKDYSLGFSFLDQEDTAIPEEEPTEVVTLYGPNGEVEAVILPSQRDRYDELIEAGYKKDPVEVTTETTVGREEPDNSGDVGGLNDGSTPSNNSTGTGKGLGISVSQGTRDSISNAVTKGLVGLTGPLGFIADTVTNDKFSDTVNDIVDNIVDGIFGPDTDDVTPSVTPEDIATDAEAQSEGVDPTDISDPQGSGSKGPSTDAQSPGPDDGSRGGSKGPSTDGQSPGPDDGSRGGAPSPSTDGQSPGPDDGSRGGAPSPSTDGPSPSPSVAGAEVGTGPDGTDSVGPMNTGGLVQRRSKKKKNK